MVVGVVGSLFAVNLNAVGQEPKTKDDDAPEKKASDKSARTRKNRNRTAPAQDATGDPRATVLRCAGRVAAGEPGFRQGWNSFRLRFGPGDWRGTILRQATAWGDGNEGKDLWGVGSPGIETLQSEVFRDQAGCFFIFSVKGDQSDSNWVACAFHYTLPNGVPGVASALFPFV
jgi:hypothetical protein